MSNEPVMCSAHPWREAQTTVNGKGMCEACDLNVTCPLCGDTRDGRAIVSNEHGGGGWLHCENPACGHRWPFRDVAVSEEHSYLAWCLAFGAWLRCVPERALWGLGLPYHWRNPRHLTDAERDRHSNLENRANDLNTRDLRAVAKLMPDFGTPDAAHMFDCSIIESLDADNEHLIPDGVTNAELLDALDSWLVARGA